MQKLTDFLDMGGYGAYVWPSYAVAAAVLAALALASIRSRRRAHQALLRLETSDET